ncbi:hypothetical protein PIIN_10862 [Serendipita indica DSM 11827]|uniref:Uncharacterized protein n=1 Tax=Serendipita indica (strain DSM 11827) TaxID=1109443 RepID=G4TZY3_SERID|nr:hypothetical protein PIIN_10862 [Serendipita indica DSM 11827]
MVIPFDFPINAISNNILLGMLKDLHPGEEHASCDIRYKELETIQVSSTWQADVDRECWNKVHQINPLEL